MGEEDKLTLVRQRWKIAVVVEDVEVPPDLGQATLLALATGPARPGQKQLLHSSKSKQNIGAT